MNIHTPKFDQDRNAVDITYDVCSLAGVIAGAADAISSGSLTDTAVARLAGDVRRTAALIETMMADVIAKLEEVERAEEKSA